MPTRTCAPTVRLISIQRLDGKQQMLVLQVLYIREDGLQSGELLRRPAHTQEVYIITALRVVLIALLKLYRRERERERERKRERETQMFQHKP